MTVTETLMALGSWSVSLSEETPDYILSQLGYFGHIAIIDGQVDPERIGDGLLAGAKYVGVLREKDNRTGRVLSGEGMAYWLGDEDGKGHLLESKLDLTGKTFVQAVTAILALDPSVVLGSVETRPGTYTGSHQYVTPREVLTLVCQAFGAEYRVNGNGRVDCGTPGFLYNTEAPDTIIVRKGVGSDLNMVALGGEPEVQESARDWSSRVVLLGQTTPADSSDPEPFVTASADAPSVPYLDLFGHPVASTRAISESGTTEGAAAARAQLQINRFARLTRSLKLNAEEFDTEGNFVVGDAVWVYDPDTQIVNAANEVLFQGQVWHPESIRSVSVTWPVVEGFTVAFRTQAGVWVDLTSWVLWESSGTDITVGDLPQSLSSGGDSTISLRVDTASANANDTTVPNAPTGLGVVAFSGLNTLGRTVSILSASWTAPGLNTDGSALQDLSYYIVQYRWTARSVWQQAATVGTAVEVAVSASLPYEVRVAAVDLSGHQSAWSASVLINSAKDSVAPPAPADPVVTSYLGQLRIEYLGTDATGNPMPTDTNRVDVHVGTTSSFTATTATLIASLSPFGKGVAFATAPYSATNNRWVRLIAYDHDGNVSASSAAVGGRTVQVADGDISSLNVGKLVSGTVNADLVVAGNILTALIGQRSGMTALGFQAWDASNNQTILLNGVANLLTGTLQTALNGNRRIVLGAAGASGEISFYAPDGTLSGRIRGLTQSNGVEAIRFGIPNANTTDTLWNHINYNTSSDGEYATYRSGTHEFVFDTTAPNEDFGGLVVFETSFRGFQPAPPNPPNTAVERFVIGKSNGAYTRFSIWQDQSFLVSDRSRSSGALVATRFWVSPTITSMRAPNDLVNLTLDNDTFGFYLGLTGAEGGISFRRAGFTDSNFRSPRMYFTTDNNNVSGAGTYSGIVKFLVRAGGVNAAFQFRNGADDGYTAVECSTLTQSSSRAGKDQIQTLDTGALDKVRAMRVTKFRRKASGGVVSTVDEIGVIAEEAALVAPDIVRQDGTMVDVGSWLGLLTAAVQELEKRSKP